MSEHFGYSHDEETFYGKCESREAALAEGRKEYGDERTIWTARHIPLDITRFMPTGDSVIDAIQDNHEEGPLEILDTVTGQQRDSLTEALRDAFKAWAAQEEVFIAYWAADDVIEHPGKVEVEA